MCARDQSSIFSTGGKFRPDYGLLLELHTLTLVAHSYVLLKLLIALMSSHMHLQWNPAYGHPTTVEPCLWTPHNSGHPTTVDTQDRQF